MVEKADNSSVSTLVKSLKKINCKIKNDWDKKGQMKN